MGFKGVRDDLDQLIREWGSHRGAEISLLKGLAATNERLDKLERQLIALGDFTEQLELRVKALTVFSPPLPDFEHERAMGREPADGQVPS